MFNLSSGDWRSVLVNFLILGVLISSVFIRSYDARWKKLRNIAIWLTIIFFITIGYNYKDVFISAFIPYKANVNSNERKIELQKANDEHFYIMLKLNDVDVLFLVDTGATTTSLTLKDAERIGIATKQLKYNIISNTANGTVLNANIEINNIKIDDFELSNLWVLINKEMTTNSLLGMNFLNKLNGYEIRGNRMVLYY